MVTALSWKPYFHISCFFLTTQMSIKYSVTNTLWIQSKCFGWKIRIFENICSFYGLAIGIDQNSKIYTSPNSPEETEKGTMHFFNSQRMTKEPVNERVLFVSVPHRGITWHRATLAMLRDSPFCSRLFSPKLRKSCNLSDIVWQKYTSFSWP